jgi:Family of unknown function (DUF6325)/FG-GAP repeat
MGEAWPAQHGDAARWEVRVSDDRSELGPIDYLVVEFPADRVTGEGLRVLVDLVDRGIVRVLDLVFVRKDLAGAVTVVAIADLDGDGKLDLAVFEGASSGLLGHEDINDAGAVLAPDRAAAILVYENLWAAPMAAALRRAGAQLVASGRIPLSEIESTLDKPASADAHAQTAERKG